MKSENKILYINNYFDIVYTKESRLHMAYGFEMLGNNFSTSFVRDTFEDFFKDFFERTKKIASKKEDFPAPFLPKIRFLFARLKEEFLKDLK